MLCFLVRTHEVIDLGVYSDQFLTCPARRSTTAERTRRSLARTDDHASIGIRIHFQEGLDNGESLVAFVRDGEDDLKVGVFLVEG